ncbi:DNA repair protein RecO [Tessaracoccus antarcticus]|uniref:DNA repair protein RecO n=1 Tax=Tessaracoccus antarcticus TaxID=2479848 RepID=A0A3M0G617_9ACTN|nr:DNA repair protein RecO [Tessaracoccus antarcticus]RMB60304.1 DNA repair protein RecO [Tessaracoccus antarcticus]
MATYRDEAVVLRTYQLGEADRIINLFTRQHGKVRAVAKGVRRTSSKFGARLEPFSHIDVQLAQGRGSLDVVTQVETLHAGLLGGDYDRFTAAEVLVEAADRLVSEDGAPALPQYRLLLGALLALADPQRSAAGIVDSYLLRSLAVAGWAVTLGECSNCGVVGEDSLWFSPQGGGTVCARCRPPSSARVDGEALEHLGALLAGDWDVVSATSQPTVNRCHGLVTAYATWHLDRALRSLPFLQR